MLITETLSRHKSRIDSRIHDRSWAIDSVYPEFMNIDFLMDLGWVGRSITFVLLFKCIFISHFEQHNWNIEQIIKLQFD